MLYLITDDETVEIVKDIDQEDNYGPISSFGIRFRHYGP